MNNHLKPKYGSIPKLRDGLVLDLPMLGVGDLHDYSMNGNNSVNNGATWVAGESGPALNFDGTSSSFVRVDKGLTDNFIAGYPFTLSASIQTTATQDDNFVFIGDRNLGNENFAIGLSSTGVAYIFARNTTVRQDLGTKIINDGRSHTIVGVFVSATERLLYVDGRLEATGTVSVIDDIIFNTIALGQLADASPGRFYDGIISTTSVISREILAQEVKDQFDFPWRDYERNNLILWAAAQGGVTPTVGNPWNYYAQLRA
jgi:hypothetical protein